MVDSSNGSDIGSVTAGVCNECIDLPTQVSIRAETFGDVNSVTLSLDGPIQYDTTENAMPWTLFGDYDSNYNGQTFVKGSYTIIAQAFSGRSGNGVSSSEYIVSFEIV